MCTRACVRSQPCVEDSVRAFVAVCRIERVCDYGREKNQTTENPTEHEAQNDKAISDVLSE